MLARILKRLGSIKTSQALVADLSGYTRAPSYTLESDIDEHPSAYPLRLEYFLEGDPNYFEPLDDAGVPVFRPDAHTRAYIPSRIAGYALSHWNLGRLDHDGEAPRAERFLRAAAWFAGRDDGLYSCDYAIGDLRTPWTSCLSQGQALSVLVRAHRLTGGDAYLETAARAWPLLDQWMEEGGLKSRLPNGAPFIEEYPGSRHTHVLNGALTAILGVDEFVAVSGDADAARLRDELLRSVADNCKLWMTGRWSAYGIERGRFGTVNACTINYQLVHIALLKRLSRVAPGYPELSNFADELQRGLEAPQERVLAFAKKTTYRLMNGW